MSLFDHGLGDSPRSYGAPITYDNPYANCAPHLELPGLVLLEDHRLLG